VIRGDLKKGAITYAKGRRPLSGGSRLNAVYREGPVLVGHPRTALLTRRFLVMVSAESVDVEGRILSSPASHSYHSFDAW